MRMSRANHRFAATLIRLLANIAVIFAVSIAVIAQQDESKNA